MPTGRRTARSSRRGFLCRAAAASAGIAGWGLLPGCAEKAEGPAFRISLAQWSFHRELFGGEMDNLEFAHRAASLGLFAVEYVNQFFMDRAGDDRYFQRMKDRSDSAGVRNLLIMCDGQGAVGDPDPVARARVVDSHHKWIEAATLLGCRAIRVNAESRGDYAEQQALAADGLRRLCELADGYRMDVLVENHGGLSSDGAWLAGVMEKVDHPRIGTLPDFGNFRISAEEEYDRYRGVEELMPWARAVSAKSYAFDAAGNETTIDYERMMDIVLAAGYDGYVGIEFEGSGSAEQGVRRTKALLERIRDRRQA